MEIITAPHQTLRQQAEPIAELEQKTVIFLNGLKKTLQKKKNPSGVGLAGNQVDRKLRAFAMRMINPEQKQVEQMPVEVIVNPKISGHSQAESLGSKHDEPDLEGCLSIPQIYGPVPRWEWVELEYQLLKNEKLTKHKKKFSGYQARIVQHEIDHLNGVLFTDHLLEHKLPAYIQEHGELVELQPRSILEVY